MKGWVDRITGQLKTVELTDAQGEQLIAMIRQRTRLRSPGFAPVKMGDNIPVDYLKALVAFDKATPEARAEAMRVLSGV